MEGSVLGESRGIEDSEMTGAVLGAERESIEEQVLGADRMPKTGEETSMKRLMRALAGGLLGLLMLLLYGLWLFRKDREEV